MVESTPISKIQELCRQRNLVIPENVIKIYEQNRRNRHLLMDCDLFAQELDIPTGLGKKRDNMITYLKKCAGKETISKYEKSPSSIEGQKNHGNRKYYQINSRGIRKILMNRNDEYRQYWPIFEDIQNELDDQKSQTIQAQQQTITDQCQKQRQIEDQYEQKEQQFKETLQKQQHIQSLTINNQEIKMYGDIQNPLFDARQILIDLLGFDKLGLNWFYKNHKKDQRFVKKMGGETTPISNEQRYHKNADIIYLTEFGLYECLFTTNKPFAFEFRLQVMQLLKDIRLGNIQLLVQKECEFTNIIQNKNSELMNFITEKSALLKQINDLKDQLESVEDELKDRTQLLDKCKKTCSLYKQKVIENNEITKEYAGSSINPEKRNKQHRSKSSNKGLREAFEQNKEVEYELVYTFEYYTEQERKQKERLLILSIPIDRRLNKQLPRIQAQ